VLGGQRPAVRIRQRQPADLRDPLHRACGHAHPAVRCLEPRQQTGRGRGLPDR
jgi:hypothetical protein